MRLSNEEIKLIKKIVNKYINADIYIFGSQLDENKKGGDLDLYLILKEKPKELDYKIGLIKILIEEKLLLKTDIIISKNKNRTIEKEALKGVKI